MARPASPCAALRAIPEGGAVRYKNLRDGEGTTVLNKVPFKFACCDCGLVHDVAIVAAGKRVKKEIGFAVKRNNRATAARRRGRGVGKAAR